MQLIEDMLTGATRKLATVGVAVVALPGPISQPARSLRLAHLPT